METLLVARGIAREVLPPLARSIARRASSCAATTTRARSCPEMKAATEEDWYTE